MKAYNEKMTFSSMTELFDGKTNFIIVPKGGIIDFDNDVFIGVEAGTTSDPFVASVCDDSKVRIVGCDGAGPVYSGWEWHDVRGYNAYVHNKSKHPEMFLYEATNVKTGQKIKFNGRELNFNEFWSSRFYKLTNKTKGDYKIAEFFTYGEIDGKKVELKIVPRIIKLSEEEIAENNYKALKRKEDAIRRLKDLIAQKKDIIVKSKQEVAKLEEKLKNLTKNSFSFQ